MTLDFVLRESKRNEQNMDHSYSSSSKSNSTLTPAMKPLTERQQMALLLQMTAEDNSTPVRKRTKEIESSNSTPRSVNRRNERGETPLHVAAIRGDAARARSLIVQGADVNTTDFAGWTPLHEAANRGHFSVARELLRNGARVDATGIDGVTPLHDAAVNGHENIVALLLRFGANPSLKTTSSKTAQDLAGSPQVVRLLAQQQGCDEDENITDENSPVEKSVSTVTSSVELSWKKKWEYPKSRRSLKLDSCPALEIDVIDSTVDEMESGATVTNLTAAEENKDGKNETDGENSSSLSQTQVSENSKGPVEEAAGHKESEASGDSQAAQKRPAETEDENDDEGKRKKRKGDEAKETKGRAASSTRGKDRKSPNTIQAENISNDSDEDKKSNEPKVPPLKIVLSNSSEADANVRSKNGNGRGSLAYVVSTNDEKNENSNGSSDKGDERSKDSTDGEKNSSSSSNGGRVTRSSQRAAATAAHSAPTSGQNSANQSPTSSPTQNQTNQTNAPSPDPSENTTELQITNINSAPTTVKAEEVKEKSSEDVTVEVHPRKRKLRPREAEPATTEPAPNAGTTSNTNTQSSTETSTAPVVITNCYDMYFSIRKQIERRHRNLLPVQPKPPQGFKDYLMNRCTYVIAGNAASRLSVPVVSPPPSLPPPMRDLFAEQEKERYRLRMQHLIEKEKLVLSVEQEILRVHGRAARALANQALPFSVCTLLKDQEVYSALTPEQEEKDRNARSRYNGRLFLSWLQDVDDKWEKIKESMLLRHHNEAESLHAVQRMDWEWKVKELGLCEPQNKPVIDEVHVPMVNVSDDFDLLPA